MTKTFLLSLWGCLILCAVQAQSEFKDGFALRMHYLVPSPHFESGEFDIQPDLINQHFNKSTYGVGIHLGRVFYLNSIQIGNRLKLAVDVTFVRYSLLIANYTTLDPTGIFYEDRNTRYRFMTTEVGPMISYSPEEDLYIEFAVRAGPQFAHGSQPPNKSATDSAFQTFPTSVWSSNFRLSPSLYLRYKKFVAGAEVSLGPIKYYQVRTNSQWDVMQYRFVLGLLLRRKD